tara:strand:+ start:5860 stop:6375 length:516 start_codon:yes stop_codon:yes gene_type:complete
MINKKVLSETALYFGNLKMPKGYEIETDLLVKNITLSHYYEDVEYSFSKTWDKINTFITDFMRVEYKTDLQSKNYYGSFYERNQISEPQFHLDFSSLKDSPDFVCLYGVEIDSDSCNIIINYDDNRRKNLRHEIKLKTNEFIIFPSSMSYYIKNKNNSYLNFIQSILYTRV